MSYPKFYTFDLNRRVYNKDKKGIGRGGPIYAEHFQEVSITGETEKEYTGPDHNINKRSMKAYWKSQPRYKMDVYTEAEREADIWVHDNRYKLVQMIERCGDIDVLKQIAKIVGYDG